MNRQLIFFLIIGTCGVLIDYGVYLLLLNLISIQISKTLGFVSGALFNFFMNRLFTWKVKSQVSKRFIRFIVLYIFTLIANVLSNDFSLNLLQSQMYYIQISFLIATSISTILNFLGQKFWVFR